MQAARRLQMKLAAHIIRENRLETVKTVAGIDVVLGCCKAYRLPETTRKAHRLASDVLS